MLAMELNEPHNMIRGKYKKVRSEKNSKDIGLIYVSNDVSKFINITKPMKA